jgi:cytochrome c peroxidase
MLHDVIATSSQVGCVVHRNCLKVLLLVCLAAFGVKSIVAQQVKAFMPTINVPLGLPTTPIPPGDSSTTGVLALGRRLFFDPILSGNHALSCASCHKPQFGFADDSPLTVGATGRSSPRNVPTVVNSAYFSSLFWDGRVSSLEKQVREPIESADEMSNTAEEVEKRLNADPSYRQDFVKAWGAGPITFDIVEKSIASFERTLLSANSPFDRWKYGHDPKAVSDSAKRGFIVRKPRRRTRLFLLLTLFSLAAGSST